MFLLRGRRKRVKRETHQRSREKNKNTEFGKPNWRTKRRLGGKWSNFGWNGLEMAQENAAFVSLSGVHPLNVKLCQQKLYRTTFDRTLGTSSLGAHFPADRKLHRRCGDPHREKKGSGAFQSHGKRPERQEPRATQARTPSPQTHRRIGCLRGRGGRGAGCLPGNLERWAGRGACWELASRSFVAQPRPSRPGRSSTGPPWRLAAAPRSRDSGFLGLKAPREFLNLLTAFIPPLPLPQHPFTFLFYTFFLNICVIFLMSVKSNHWIYKIVQHIWVMKRKDTNAELFLIYRKMKTVILGLVSRKGFSLLQILAILQSQSLAMNKNR